MKRYQLNHVGLAIYEIVDTHTVVDGRFRMVCIFAHRGEAIRRCDDLNRYGEAAA